MLKLSKIQPKILQWLSLFFASDFAHATTYTIQVIQFECLKF
jgi:hypothetical protein